MINKVLISFLSAKIIADLEYPYFMKNQNYLQKLFDGMEERDLHDGSNSVDDLDNQKKLPDVKFIKLKDEIKNDEFSSIEEIKEDEEFKEKLDSSQ